MLAAGGKVIQVENVPQVEKSFVGYDVRTDGKVQFAIHVHSFRSCSPLIFLSLFLPSFFLHSFSFPLPCFFCSRSLIPQYSPVIRLSEARFLSPAPLVPLLSSQHQQQQRPQPQQQQQQQQSLYWPHRLLWLVITITVSTPLPLPQLKKLGS